jgi:methylmalonyl-CoA/ethylmalonyl-CoA epimerase
MKIEHLGIAVSNLEQSIKAFSDLLGTSPYKTEVVESEGVKTVFFQVGDSKIELLEATHEQSAIAKFISKRGEGLHHVAFAVDHIESEMERLKSEGYTLINESPKEGADQKLICFIHPKSTGGILIELCQDRP